MSNGDKILRIQPVLGCVMRCDYIRLMEEEKKEEKKKW